MKEKTTSEGLFLQPSGIDSGDFSFSPMGNNIISGNITPWCPGWNKSTHSCLVRDGEISISLWDVKHITGLPIDGDIYYDEYNPFEIDSSLQQLYDRYFKLISEGRSSVSGDVWISTWFEPDEAVNIEKAPSRDDPFSIKTYGNRLDDPYWKFRNRQRVSGDIFLASFLAFWLSVFVFPSDNGNVVRPETFGMAHKMARGIRVSLATSVLSLIYESLDLISQSQNPTFVKFAFPFII